MPSSDFMVHYLQYEPVMGTEPQTNFLEVLCQKWKGAVLILRGKSKKYRNENMPVECFGSHFSHNGHFNLIS